MIVHMARDTCFFKELVLPQDPPVFDEIRRIALGRLEKEAFVQTWKNIRAPFLGTFTQADAHPEITKAVQDFRLPECAAHLVFVNGRFSSKHSTSVPGMSVMPYVHASSSHPVIQHWLREAKDEKDSFHLLRSAAFQDGLLVSFAPDATFGPVQVVYLCLADHPSWVMPRLYFEVGEGTQAHVIETWSCQTQAPMLFHSDVVADIAAHARFSHSLLQLAGASTVACCSSLRATVHAQADYRFVHVCDTSLHRHSCDILLAGEEASCSGAVLDLVADGRESHLRVDIEHQAPRTRSTMIVKGLLGEESLAHAECTVRVQGQAPLSSSSQLIRYLQLGRSGQAKIQPKFEMYTDEVEASHGATTSQIEEEILAYLTCRGLNRREAVRFVANGFASQIVRMLSSEQERQWVCLSMM